jgi:hypothetical protein
MGEVAILPEVDWSHKGTKMKFGWVTPVLVLLFITVGLSQEEKSFEPEYSSVFYYLGAAGQPVELERQAIDPIFKGRKSLYVIPGEKSPVRLRTRDSMQFVVRITEDFEEAAATIQLFRFAVQNGTRQLLLKQSDFISNKISLKLETEKYGRSSLKLVPSTQLAPGEYCISRTTIRQGYCFGVDVAPAEVGARATDTQTH